MLPTTEQSTWLTEYYRTFGRAYLAEKLSITDPVLIEWLQHLGLKKKKDSKRPWLNDDDKEFIKSNYKSMTHEQLAARLNRPIGVVQRYCYQEYLYKTAAAKYKPTPKKIIPYHPPTKELVRPAAKYDNVSSDDLIDKYLKK